MFTESSSVEIARDLTGHTRAGSSEKQRYQSAAHFVSDAGAFPSFPNPYSARNISEAVGSNQRVCVRPKTGPQVNEEPSE